MIENAGKSGAQVVCLQEAWSKLRLLIQKHLQIISVIYPYHTHRTHYLEGYTKYLSRFNIETVIFFIRSLYTTIILLKQYYLAMPFAFCTREKHPWTQFAESAETGATTAFLSEVGGYREEQYQILSYLASCQVQDGDRVPNTGEGRGSRGGAVEHGCGHRSQGEVPGEDEEEPHPPGGGLQRVHLLHGGEHWAQGVQYCVWEDSSQHLLRETPPTELDDVRGERGRDRVQPQRYSGGTIRAYVGNRGKERCYSKQLLHLRYQQGWHRTLSKVNYSTAIMCRSSIPQAQYMGGGRGRGCYQKSLSSMFNSRLKRYVHKLNIVI